MAATGSQANQPQSYEAQSRALILSRRAGGIGSFDEATLNNGDLDLAQAITNGVYKINCAHQVGIATSTEVGLSSDRFPIRFIIVPAGTINPTTTVDTCASYWRVVNVQNIGIPFARKPIATEAALRQLYNLVPTLDQKLWTAYQAMGYAVVAPNVAADTNAILERLYVNLMVPNPTAEQILQVTNDVDLVITTFQAMNMAPRFKICENVYMIGEPHGKLYPQIGDLTPSAVAFYETVLCAQVNRARLAARYTDVKAGAITMASHCIANMFRMGLFESHEHKEYFTVTVNSTGAGVFTVVSVSTPPGITAPTDIVAGTQYNLTGVKVHSKMLEVANSLVMSSGLMHYLFNHTTGGQTMSGVLLSTMAMYNLVNRDLTHEGLVRLTSVMYEALHPSNKRGIANIFFDHSGVLTHGRISDSPRYEKFELDSFMALRANPYPAGSHKAMICMLGLKRVIQSGLSPFLPWAEQLTGCVATCEEVLSAGARAHIGSHYYTGEPPQVQSSSLDQYLPEIAQYVHTFNKGDSLSMSPHMSNEVARRSAMNWQNLLKDIRAKDVSSTPAETVRAYLQSAGGTYFNFNPDDQATWGQASETAQNALARINALFL